MSESKNNLPADRPVITPSDLVQIVRGIASSEVRGRFLEAYNDPTSGLHEVLLGMEEWGHGLPGGQGGSVYYKSQQKKFADRLEHVRQFVQRKQSEHVLTVEEAEGILTTAGSIESASSPRQAMAAIARIAAMLDEARPELHDELVNDIQSREASKSR